MEINKYIQLLATLVVGTTFVFSGAVKLNDPVGFAYKIEEYLHVLASQWIPHLRIFLPYTLILAVGIATLETVLGTALLTHWQPYWILRVLLLLTFFFTGLTLYTATTSRITSCGCFGDAWNLTPWQSFGKSILLLLLLGALWQSGSPGLTSLMGHYWVLASFVAALGLSTYSIRHLPVLDWGPYHVGSHLAQRIQPRRPLRYLYVLEKDGQTIETEHYPPQPGYKFITSQLLNPEDVPEVAAFSIWQGQEECTQALLTGHKLLLVVQQGAIIPATTLHSLKALMQQLPPKVQPILLSTDIQGKAVATALGLPLHTATPILLRTLLRAPIGLLRLQEGVVKGKWHYRDLAKAQKGFCK